jgi:hypothetical protein
LFRVEKDFVPSEIDVDKLPDVPDNDLKRFRNPAIDVVSGGFEVFKRSTLPYSEADQAE